MATHSSILAWRIPGTEEPNVLASMKSHRVRHNWSDLAAAAECMYVIKKVKWTNLLRCSVQFSHSVVSYSLRPHESQHTRPPCPSPTQGVHSNSPPSSRWCHPAISSSVVPFSSCPQSLPASVFSNESTLLMRWPKYWRFSFSISPSKEYPGLIFRMDWLYLLAVQGTLKSVLQHHSSKASQSSLWSNSHICTWLLEKP